MIQLQNLGKANAKGLELALKGTWAGGFEGRASYSFTDARDGITGARLVDSPEQLGKFDLTAPLYREKVFATLECQNMSDRETLAGQTDPAWHGQFHAVRPAVDQGAGIVGERLQSV